MSELMGILRIGRDWVNVGLHAILARPWVSELVSVGVLLLLLVRVYFRYVSAATQPNLRIRRRRTATTLVHTRVWLVILVIGLLALFGYDHFGS